MIVGNQIEIGSEARTQAINSMHAVLRNNAQTGNIITDTFTVQGPATVGRFMPYEDIQIQQDP